MYFDDTMKSRTPGRAVLATLLAFLAFVVPYGLNASWKFIPSTLAILAVYRFLVPDAFPQVLGLSIPARSIPWILVVLAASLVGAKILADHLALVHGLHAATQPLDVGWRLLPIFQVLNEEMLLRAALLWHLRRLTRSTAVISVGAAAAFVLLHLVFYRVGAGETLPPGALLSLFFFSLAGNEVYLQTGHIGYPFAVHVAWNLQRFGRYWMFDDGGALVTEYRGFVLFEGDRLVVGLSLAMAVACVALVHLRSARRRRV